MIIYTLLHTIVTAIADINAGGGTSKSTIKKEATNTINVGNMY